MNGNLLKLSLRTAGAFKEDDEVIPRCQNHIVCCKTLLNILASVMEERPNQEEAKYELSSSSDV